MRATSLKKIYFVVPVALLVVILILLSFEKQVTQVQKEEALDVTEFTK